MREHLEGLEDEEESEGEADSDNIWKPKVNVKAHLGVGGIYDIFRWR